MTEHVEMSALLLTLLELIEVDAAYRVPISTRLGSQQRASVCTVLEE